jgi:hypothetical protein
MVKKTTFESDAINMVQAFINEIKKDKEEKHLTAIRNIFIQVISILNSCINSPDNAPYIDDRLNILDNKITVKLNYYENNDVVVDVVKILDRICLKFTDKTKHNKYNYTFEKLDILRQHVSTFKY